jgi:hypothetical protein
MVRGEVARMGAYVRLVTEEEVGELGRRLTRARAQAVADLFNALPGPRPVEYDVERRGFCRWAIVGCQAKLVPVRELPA